MYNVELQRLSPAGFESFIRAVQGSVPMNVSGCFAYISAVMEPVYKPVCIPPAMPACKAGSMLAEQASKPRLRGSQERCWLYS